MIRNVTWAGIALALVAGCAPTIEDTPATPTASVAAPTPPAPASAMPTQEVAAGPVTPSGEALAGVLLALSDLEPGYTQDVERSGEVTYEMLGDEGSPNTAEFIRNSGQFPAYRAVFGQEESVILQMWVVVFDDALKASGFLQTFPGLNSRLFTFESMSFPALGEESVAYETTPLAEAEVERYDVLVRENNVVAFIVIVWPAGESDLSELEAYARTLALRLQAAVEDA